MSDMLHRITIEAPPDRVYDAFTTRDGLRAWWTADSEAEPRVGSVAEFGFHDRMVVFRMVVFRMEVDELVPHDRAHWTCVGGPDEWVGPS